MALQFVNVCNNEFGHGNIRKLFEFSAEEFENLTLLKLEEAYYKQILKYKDDPQKARIIEEGYRILRDNHEFIPTTDESVEPIIEEPEEDEDFDDHQSEQDHDYEEWHDPEGSYEVNDNEKDGGDNIANHINQLYQNDQNLRESLDKYVSEINGKINKETHELRSTLEELRRLVSDFETKAEELNTKNSDLVKRMEGCRDFELQLEEQFINMEGLLGNKSHRHEEKIQALEANFKELETSYESLKVNYEALKNSGDVKEMKEEIRKLKEEKYSSQARMTTMEKLFEDMQENNRTLMETVSALQEKIERPQIPLENNNDSSDIEAQAQVLKSDQSQMPLRFPNENDNDFDYGSGNNSVEEDHHLQGDETVEEHPQPVNNRPINDENLPQQLVENNDEANSSSEETFEVQQALAPIVVNNQKDSRYNLRKRNASQSRSLHPKKSKRMCNHQSNENTESDEDYDNTNEESDYLNTLPRWPFNPNVHIPLSKRIKFELRRTREGEHYKVVIESSKDSGKFYKMYQRKNRYGHVFYICANCSFRKNTTCGRIGQNENGESYFYYTTSGHTCKPRRLRRS